VIQTNNAKLFPWTMAVVGKFHFAAHKLDCRTRFSFNYLPGVGVVDGEASKRMWATLSQFSKRTREMNPGYRRDSINNLYRDLCFRRVHSIGTCTILKCTWVLSGLAYSDVLVEQIHESSQVCSVV
jgi:hypothetical protein